MQINFERPQPLAKLVADRLRTAIVEGAFSMGQPLSESMLAKLFNVSKTPIKHALAELCSEGIVDIVPRKGSYVFTITPEDLVHLCDMREALETKALQSAHARNKSQLVSSLETIYRMMLKARETQDTIEYLRQDSLYHQTIMELSENPYLINAYKAISVKSRAAFFHLADDPLARTNLVAEHDAILQDLKGDNLDGALAILRKHVHRHTHIDFSRLQDFGTRNMTILSQALL